MEVCIPRREDARYAPDALRAFLADIKHAVAKFLHISVTQSKRLPLIQRRFAIAMPGDAPPTLRNMCARRAYVLLPRRRQREALCRLVFSEHILAVELLRRAPAASPIPRHRRICRFCELRWAIEDEGHALLECPAPRLASLRTSFLATATAVMPALIPLRRRLSSPAFLDVLLNTDKVLPLFGDYVADVFGLATETPPLLIASDNALAALRVAL